MILSVCLLFRIPAANERLVGSSILISTFCSMNTKQIDTLLKLKSSGQVLKSNLDHFRTVKDIINEKLVPDLAVCLLSLC